MDELQRTYGQKRGQTTKEYWLATAKYYDPKRNEDKKGGTVGWLPLTRFERLADLFSDKFELKIVQKCFLCWFQNARFQQVGREFHNYMNANYLLLTQKRMILANLRHLKALNEEMKKDVGDEFKAFEELVECRG